MNVKIDQKKFLNKNKHIENEHTKKIYEMRIFCLKYASKNNMVVCFAI